MGSRLMRRMGIFDQEEDPRWREEYELNQTERARSESRVRQYRIEDLISRLHGLDRSTAEHIACQVWESERRNWARVCDRSGFKLVEFHD